MSHIATVQIEIRNLEVLRRACERVGLEFCPGQTECCGYFDSDVAHVIRVPEAKREEILLQVRERTGVNFPSPMEIAVVAAAGRPGSFTLHYEDDYGGAGLELLAGRGCVELRKSYALEAAKAQARSMGFRTAREHLRADGKWEIVFQK